MNKEVAFYAELELSLGRVLNFRRVFKCIIPADEAFVLLFDDTGLKVLEQFYDGLRESGVITSDGRARCLNKWIEAP